MNSVVRAAFPLRSRKHSLWHEHLCCECDCVSVECIEVSYLKTTPAMGCVQQSAAQPAKLLSMSECPSDRGALRAELLTAHFNQPLLHYISLINALVQLTSAIGELFPFPLVAQLGSTLHPL